jgi:transposase
MKLKDARSLTPQAQEALRKRAVRAVLSGMTTTRAANVFGVARGTVSGWMKQYAAEGERGLNRHRRGRPPAPRLSGQRAAALKRAITQHCPDELGLPYALWTREAVGALIRERFGMTLSVWTVGRYLRRFGLTPQKPARRAFEQDPKAVEHWLTEEYPAIRRQAHAEGAEIHWGDEMGLRSDHQAGRSWGKRGKTPVVPGTGKRFRCNVISSLTHRGTLRFRVFEGRFNAQVFIDFMRRLLGSTSQKVFLIVDRHPVHLSKAVKAWLERHTEQIRLFLLPTYSPEYNPGEFLNQDVKANSVGRRRAHNKRELMANVRGYLRSAQQRPHQVKRYFLAESVRYAAA